MQLEGARRAEDRDQVAAAAPGGGNVERALHETDARVGGGDTHVAGRRELGAAAERDAVQRRDHRHREIADGLQRAVAQVEEIARLLSSAYLLQVAQVSSRRETALAGAGKQRQAELFVPVRLEHLAQARQHRARQRIALVRPVDGDPEQPITHAGENVVAHRAAQRPSGLAPVNSIMRR